MKYKLEEIHMITQKHIYAILEIIATSQKTHIYEIYQHYNIISYKHILKMVHRLIDTGIVNDLGMNLSNTGRGARFLSLGHKGQTLYNLISALV